MYKNGVPAEFLRRQASAAAWHGMEEIDTQKEKDFAPLENVISVGPSPEMPNLSIVEVREGEWMRGGELFRPAKVRANKVEALSTPEGAYQEEAISQNRMRDNHAEDSPLETGAG